MTKEEKYCKEQGITPYDEYDDNSIKQAYSDGYNAAESDNEEMMCKFAEWVNNGWHEWQEEGISKYKSLFEEYDNEYCTQELLTIFKESLKQ